MFRFRFQCWRVLRRTTVIAALWAALAGQGSAVELSLVRTNITMYAGRTFQMPLNGSDPQGSPLTFSVVSVKPSKLTARLAPATNPSLVLNVSGVDETNAPFTGNLVLQLYADLTPLTTARIIDLVNSNFYNGLTFYRIATNFVAQCGNMAGQGPAFDDEFVTNLTYSGFAQVGMANSGPDSNLSEFFITDPGLSVNDPAHPSPEYLSFAYTLFGQMTSGFDVLQKMMGTPLESLTTTPVTPIVINNASLINDTSNAVLRLSAEKGFKGTVAVTISAENTSHETATQTLDVNVIPDPNSYAPFLGPIPASTVITQNQAATFLAPAFDISESVLALQYELDATNLVSGYASPRSDRVWFLPAVTLTGEVDMVLYITDGVHSPDTHHFSVTFLPWNPTPTMTITPLKGMMEHVSKANGDRVTLTGAFSFNDPSTSAFTSNDIVTLTLGDPGNPLMVGITPNVPVFKLSKGVLTTSGFATFAPSDSVKVTSQFNASKGTFSLAVSGFSFPSALTNLIEVGIAIGSNYGSNVESWVQTKPGIFVPPPVP